MGAGASTLPRIRKAILMRAYNVRPAEQTLLEQFVPFAYREADHQMYILPSQIKKCLDMNKPDYYWFDELLRTLFILPNHGISKQTQLLSSSKVGLEHTGWFHKFCLFA